MCVIVMGLRLSKLLSKTRCQRKMRISSHILCTSMYVLDFALIKSFAFVTPYNDYCLFSTEIEGIFVTKFVIRINNIIYWGCQFNFRWGQFIIFISSPW